MPSVDKIVRRIDLSQAEGEQARLLLRREWLATNGVGGYASGTISGSVAWRYHGLLIAALAAPSGRMVMLNHLSEFIRFPNGREVQISGEEPGPEAASSARHFTTEFRLENGLPIWRYEVEGIVLEKHVLFLYGQNTVHVHYELLSGSDDVRLELSPSIHFRGHEQEVNHESANGYLLCATNDHYEVSVKNVVPKLRLVLEGERRAFVYDGGTRREIYYPKEAERGCPARGWRWSPGRFCVTLHVEHGATLIASTEWWTTMLALSPKEALGFYHARHKHLIAQAASGCQVSPAADLVLAADQFVINPVGRIQDAARAHAAGDDIRTVIAGYHWFTDWGRDTMISLEGLALVTRRFTEAGWILRTFAHYIRNGLIPNLFPEGRNEGLYHTADASLWFFHALARYLEWTADRSTLRLILPKLRNIVEHHLKGTLFGIGVDPRDGLLRQGAPGYQLTWMDAKVDNWVVTPRRGKAVEINGLWYNALKLLEKWLREEYNEPEAQLIGEQAQRVKESFNRRFWPEHGSSLYDVVDGENGDDPACRPNQLLSFSLEYPVLNSEHWEPVLESTREHLLTPLGLRSLAPGHPEYKPKYFGDLRARDAAYHQGTVWAWLIGPFIDCYLKVYPGDKTGARKLLQGFVPHLNEGCIGSINEIFDAEPPFTPRGCIAQAWSVAEVLRCWVKTEANDEKNQGQAESQIRNPKQIRIDQLAMVKGENRR